MVIYKISENNTDWENAMFFAAKHLEATRPYDIQTLALDIEKISEKYQAEINENDSFIVPIKNGDYLRFIFHKNGYMDINQSIDNEEELITEITNGEQENHILKQISRAYQQAEFGIGERYPSSLNNYILDAKLGDVLTLNQHMYVCHGRYENGVAFTEIPVSIANHTVKQFKNTKGIVIAFNDDHAIQKLFDKNKDLYISSVDIHCGLSTQSQEWLNSLYAGFVGTKTIKLGDIKLIVQKHEKELIWRDSHGTLITPETVKLIHAWTQTAPVERKIQGAQNMDKICFMKELQELYARNEFAKAYQLIIGHCQHKGYVYQERSFVNGVPHAFAFHIENNQVQVYRLKYQNDDFSKLITKIIPSSEQEFISFCQAKYNEHYQYFLHDTINRYQSKYPNATSQIAQQIIYQAAEKEAKQQTVELLDRQPLITENELIALNNEIDELLTAYDETEYPIDEEWLK